MKQGRAYADETNPEGGPRGRGGLFAAAGVASAQTKTLDTVKSRGSSSCGVNIGLAGLQPPDDKGNWTGLDVDYCRAIAAAVFGDATKVKFVPTTAKERFTALQSGEIDVLSATPPGP